MQMYETQFNRPTKVSWAVYLLYASLFIGVVNGLLWFGRLSKPNSIFFAVFIVTSALYVSWLLTFKISKGKNWARLTYLILFIIGLLFIKPILISFTTNPLQTGIENLPLLMQGIAIILLFQKTSTKWFQQMKTDAQQGHGP
jgi:hypothetical protein